MSSSPDLYHSIRWGSLFPGRNRVTVQELAKGMELSVGHVINLIEGGDLDAEAVSQQGTRKLPKTERYRITEQGWDAFIEGRKSK